MKEFNIAVVGAQGSRDEMTRPWATEISRQELNSSSERSAGIA